MDETDRRRTKQQAYNEEHGIEPKTILKDIHNPLVRLSQINYYDTGPVAGAVMEVAEGSHLPLRDQIAMFEKRMKAAAKNLDFEEAAQYRDRLWELREIQVYVE